MSMEKEALTIPKDVFHSKFRWSFFQARKDPIFCLFLITCVVIKFSRFEGSVSVLVILVGSYLAGARRALKKNIEKLCNEVIDQRPGADTLKWNLITQRLNGLLYDEGLYNNPYCIFDGEHCQELFRELVLEPSLQKSDKLYLETANFAKASRLYQEDLLRQWKDFADNGKLEDSEERESYEKLSWHTHYNEVFWSMCRFLSFTLQPPYCLCPLVAIRPKLSVTRNSLALIVVYLFVVLSYRRIKIEEMKIEARLTFLKTVSLVRPHAQVEGWNVVAKRMNKYMYEEKGWHSKEFFHDGEDCSRYFKMEFTSSTAPTKYRDLKPFIETAVKFDGTSEENDV